MKKILSLVLLVICFAAYAEIVKVEGYGSTAIYTQFTHNDLLNIGNYVDGANPGQNWLGAQTILLNIDNECDVWFSNYVNSWYDPKPLNPLNGNVFDMDANKYGLIKAETDVPQGTGKTAMVTYGDGNGHTNSTEAYYVGHFQAGDSLYLAMTTLPEDGAEGINSKQYVYDADHDTTLWSRLDNTYDLAGNVRINFGLEDYVAHEFVAFGVSEPSQPPMGQPLPGTLATLAIMGSVVGAAYKRRKNK